MLRRASMATTPAREGLMRHTSPVTLIFVACALGSGCSGMDAPLLSATPDAGDHAGEGGAERPVIKPGGGASSGSPASEGGSSASPSVVDPGDGRAGTAAQMGAMPQGKSPLSAAPAASSSPSPLSDVERDHDGKNNRARHDGGGEHR